MTSPEVSWLFFKARAKRPYLSHTGRASNAEKQPTGPGPEGCVENGPTAALLVGYVSIQICALLAPCRRPILNATTSPLFVSRYTRIQDLFRVNKNPGFQRSSKTRLITGENGAKIRSFWDGFCPGGATGLSPGFQSWKAQNKRVRPEG